MVFEQLWMVGIDERVPLPIREQYFPRIVPWPLKGVEEMVLVSTCQRQEVYLVGGEEAGKKAEKVFFPRFPQEQPLLRLSGKEAVRHLFRVACGIESLALGEHQVLGQVKRAWERAHRERWSGKVLNRLFLRAITLGKKVRAETALGSASLSVSALAIQLAERFWGSLQGKRVFLIGTGEMGRLLIRYFLERGVEEIRISSRTPERTALLRKEFPTLRVFPWQEKYRYLRGCDILVSVTEAPHHTIDLPSFQRIFPGGPRFLLDLGVPRNIDPAIGNLEGVVLFTLQDLQGVAEENRRRRWREMVRVEQMVEEATRCFWPSLQWELFFKAFELEFEELTLLEVESLVRELPVLQSEKEAVTEVVRQWNHRLLVSLKKALVRGSGDEKRTPDMEETHPGR
ncbi:MAG: glutamyl-tRNA reductase [Candidatus Caldatribacteriaceae bacterium]